MAILIGQNLGKYTILERLGEGGMANVYKSRDTKLNRFVAIKVLRTGTELEEKSRLRFEREARALAALTHPNIVGIIDYGEQDGTPYLVMPYLPGGTLKKRVGKAMTWREALKLLLPIARALEYAHQQNIIHRDIKPSNILITASGEPMLSDFGIARILEGRGPGGLTTTGIALGTPEYMAPEQLMEGGREERQDAPLIRNNASRTVKKKRKKQAIDGRVDEYALGVVLYELITGRKPYQAETLYAVVAKQISGPLPLPCKLVPDLPEGVEMLLVKALAKNRQDRFADLGEMALEMEKLLQSVQAEAVKTGRNRGNEKAQRSDKTRQRKTKSASGRKLLPVWPFLAGGIVIVGLLVAAILVSTGVKNRAAVVATYTPTTEPTGTLTHIPEKTSTPMVTLTPTTQAGATRARETDGMIEIYIPAGEFLMGADVTDPIAWSDEKPQHTVYLDAYWIDQHEVTNGQYALCVAAGSCTAPQDFSSCFQMNYYSDSSYENFPVINVDWHQVCAFCAWVGGSLPTEAQWEKAARGTQGSLYPWGYTAPTASLLNYDNHVGDATIVCSYPDGNSPYGLCDMAGNVWEWVNDWYDNGYYASSPLSNPFGPADGENRVLRGGSWVSQSQDVRTCFRLGSNPSGWDCGFGFRCVHQP